MKFSALCSDIDGTLLDRNRELSERTIAAIRHRKPAVPVVLASSRMPAAMRHLQQTLDVLRHPLICYNGGYVICDREGTEEPEVLTSVYIPLALCEAILTLADPSLHISLFAADRWYAQGPDAWTERESRITKVNPTFKAFQNVLNEWRVADTGAHKVMCMGDEAHIEAMYNTLVNTFPDDLHVYRSKSTYLELAPKTISKATGLQLVLSRLSIDPKEVIAFGDNYNDVELLDYVGWGVAVDNARDEVKAVANEITAHNKEDGVAMVIEKYF
ncbi:Cof-type HAD-IIB family hydrolase [Chryseolinea lacunae]|uniref:HAD family phosphatase n=1 Tax=Chryseolinea lacunae TaxID=2801331 RepID=A0ABS1KZW9_9BACT|nr:Cof-type HAD-IIB family hydrolase [Chryseolinea lacunae]MBL0745001.1 HAD family phosphatase [Chryseolinea lacunae]